jgi:hypothetical protein
MRATVARAERICGAVLLCFLVAATVCTVRAEEGGTPPETPAQRKLNPLGYAIYVPATLSFSFAPHRDAQPALNFQPRIPLGLTEDWRIITRSNVPIVHLPAPDDATGLGDIDTSLFLTPGRTGKWVWGVGPILQFPTATDAVLGTEKWSAGPTAALLYVDGPWVNGILVSQLWSFAGPSRRADVSLMQIELQLSYTFSNDWYVQTAPTISRDWRAPAGEGWIVPIGADAGKVFKIGSKEMGLQLGAYYNLEKPTGAAEWVLQTQISWLY